MLFTSTHDIILARHERRHRRNSCTLQHMPAASKYKSKRNYDQLPHINSTVAGCCFRHVQLRRQGIHSGCRLLQQLPRSGTPVRYTISHSDQQKQKKFGASREMSETGDIKPNLSSIDWPCGENRADHQTANDGELRNTPVHGIASPAQLSMSRRLHSSKLCTTKHLRPAAVEPTVSENILELKQTLQQTNYAISGKDVEPLHKLAHRSYLFTTSSLLVSA